MTEVVVATRSEHKLSEIRQILPTIPGLRLLDLTAARVEHDPVEEEIEKFETFEENALAKARHFAERTGRPVLADDSGLSVDALKGAPGVRTKRFSGRGDLGGLELDRANNEHLLERLRDVPEAERTAHYVCVIAIARPDGDHRLFRGTVRGRIAEAPRGSGGFGYDPLFYVEPLGATFAEVTPEVKNRLSHRGRAVLAAAEYLRELVDPTHPKAAGR
jgi:XTP/dITP diphosphohydrolase